MHVLIVENDEVCRSMLTEHFTANGAITYVCAFDDKDRTKVVDALNDVIDPLESEE